jgi:hypothetical protein
VDCVTDRRSPGEPELVNAETTASSGGLKKTFQFRSLKTMGTIALESGPVNVRAEGTRSPHSAKLMLKTIEKFLSGPGRRDRGTAMLDSFIDRRIREGWKFLLDDGL